MTRAIPLSEPGTDPASAAQLLDKLQKEYPGELFFVEENGEGATVSWIPSWYIQQFLGGLLYNALWQTSPAVEPW